MKNKIEADHIYSNLHRATFLVIFDCINDTMAKDSCHDTCGPVFTAKGDKNPQVLT
jgi:hypothetical protein